MPKGIFCMAKNLTEVIGTMEKDQRKEFYQASLNKGKIFVIVNALLWNIMVTFCFLAALKSRSMNQIIYAYLVRFSTFVLGKSIISKGLFLTSLISNFTFCILFFLIPYPLWIRLWIFVLKHIIKIWAHLDHLICGGQVLFWKTLVSNILCSQ